MGYIFDDWKDLLDEFQKCVDKDLAEIQKQKAEVQQIKEGLFNSFGGGLLYRDGNRIVISAPEIVIGNVDRTGTLQGGGVGKLDRKHCQSCTDYPPGGCRSRYRREGERGLQHLANRIAGM